MRGKTPWSANNKISAGFLILAVVAVTLELAPPEQLPPGDTYNDNGTYNTFNEYYNTTSTGGSSEEGGMYFHKFIELTDVPVNTLTTVYAIPLTNKTYLNRIYARTLDTGNSGGWIILIYVLINGTYTESTVLREPIGDFTTTDWNYHFYADNGVFNPINNSYLVIRLDQNWGSGPADFEVVIAYSQYP